MDSNMVCLLFFLLQDCDPASARVLVAFGANINATNQHGRTPLDMLKSAGQEEQSLSPRESSISPKHSRVRSSSSSRQRSAQHQARKVAEQKCLELLQSIGALEGEIAARVSVVPRLQAFPLVPSSSPSLPRFEKIHLEALDWGAQLASHYSELERNINSRLQNTSKAGQAAVFSVDSAVSLAAQLQEMVLFQKAGSRVLCLDGGGIRGLIQLEILSQLEQKTGRRITELFDWIIGTSTGGVIALGLVYGELVCMKSGCTQEGSID